MVLIGAIAGTSLGILARIWMRVIATDPEFTWNGTISIVLGFTIFGTTQGLTALARRRGWRPAAARAVRVVGIVGMMPLFVAAGAPMMPTVVGGGLALWRTDWPRWVRALFAVVSVVPVVLVSRKIIDDFGWDTRTVVGISLMLGVYGCIIRAARATMLRPLRPLRLRWVALVAGAAAALVLVAQAGLSSP